MFKQSLLIFAFLFYADAALALTDQSWDIRAVLENGKLSQADCDRYHAGQQDDETTLRCGKFMFLYDPLGIPGLPQGLVDLLRKNAPMTIGESFEGFGFYKDPFSPKALPVGLVEGLPQPGWFKGYAMTCGSCHFQKLDDGRYVIGQPNHNLEFGKMNLVLALAPELALAPKTVLPANVEEKTRAVWKEFFHGLNGLKVIGETIKLLPNVIATGKKPMKDEDKIKLGMLSSGVLDPFSAPAKSDDVTIPHRILPLWGIDPKGMVDAGSTHGAMLTAAGGMPNLQAIFRSIGATSVFQGGKDYYEMFGPEYWKPLETYILSLKAPKNLAKLDSTRVQNGKRTFESNCTSCHSGPAYAGTRIFSFAEIGTDANQQWFADPDHDGKSINELFLDSEMTGGVKAVRLEGLWSYKRYLHNGSINSLEELFCVDGPRPAAMGPGYSNQGHEWTCNDYAREDKLDMIAFLRSL